MARELKGAMHEGTNLTTIGISVEHWHQILVLMMIERFYEQTANEWEKQRPILHKDCDFLMRRAHGLAHIGTQPLRAGNKPHLHRPQVASAVSLYVHVASGGIHYIGAQYSRR